MTINSVITVNGMEYSVVIIFKIHKKKLRINVWSSLALGTCSITIVTSNVHSMRHQLHCYVTEHGNWLKPVIDFREINHSALAIDRADWRTHDNVS